MQIAHNPETGEYLGLQNGQWSKLQVAANDAGQKLYLGPDGWLPLDTGSAANPNSPAQERGAGRSLGLGTRNVMEGIGGLVGSVTSPIANVVDRATGGSGRRFGNPGAAVADALGLPTPQNSDERVYGNIIEGASGTFPTLGAGAALQAVKVGAPMLTTTFNALPTAKFGASLPGKAADLAVNFLPRSVDAVRSLSLLGNQGVRNDVGRKLFEAPVLQFVSGALGGDAVGEAQESGVGPGGQIAAGLAAGALPFLGAAAANTVGRGVRSMAGAADRLTESGQQRLAGTAFERMAKDPAGVRAALSDGTDGVLVPGSLPTTAQRVADPGIALLEKAMQQTPEGWAIRERYTAQQDARREGLNNLLNPVAERQTAAIEGVGRNLADAAPYGGTTNEQTAGRQIRSAYDSEYGAMRDKVNQAYQSIDPEGKTRVDAQPLLDRWMQHLDPDDIDDLPPLARKEFGRLAGLMESGEPVTFDRLQKARTRIANSAPMDDKNGQRLVGIMKRQLDDFINNMALAPEQASAFENAKALRQAQGARFEQGANAPLSMRGDELGGQKIADSAIPGNYLAKGPQGFESMDAFGRSVGGNQDAQAAIADHIMATAISSSTKNGVIDPAMLGKFLETYRPALETLDNATVNQALENALTSQQQNFAARDALGKVAKPDSAGNWKLSQAQRQFPAIPEQAGLTTDEAARLGALQQDSKRALDNINMAAVNGSPTAQLTRVMNDLGRFKSGTMGGGGMVRNVLNDVISRLTAHADDKIENMLIQGVLDPEYALKLMSNTNNMPGNGLLDSARRWTGSGGGESYADMLKRYGVATTVGAGRTPAQAEQKRK